MNKNRRIPHYFDVKEHKKYYCKFSGIYLDKQLNGKPMFRLKHFN